MTKISLYQPKGWEISRNDYSILSVTGSKISSAYDELRNSNILRLPRKGTLSDYKNAMRPHAGFNRSVIDELIKIASPLTYYQRCAVLSFDEIKIQQNLVFD